MELLMNATVGQLIGGGCGIIAILSLFIEFAPVKVNPISSVLNWIGQRTNKGLLGRVEELEKAMENISKECAKIEEKAAEREAVNCRVRILQFADEIRRKIKHSKESFDQVLSDMTIYKNYCKDNPKFENNKTVVASEVIDIAYHGCIDQNDFL